MAKIITIALLSVLALIMLRYYFKGRSPFKNLLLGALSGAGALLIVSLIFTALGHSFGLNYTTLAASLITGVPGVIIMTVANILFKL